MESTALQQYTRILYFSLKRVLGLARWKKSFIIKITEREKFEQNG